VQEVLNIFCSINPNEDSPLSSSAQDETPRVAISTTVAKINRACLMGKLQDKRMSAEPLQPVALDYNKRLAQRRTSNAQVSGLTFAAHPACILSIHLSSNICPQYSILPIDIHYQLGLISCH
jgi:hypothetical protein